MTTTDTYDADTVELARPGRASRSRPLRTSSSTSSRTGCRPARSRTGSPACRWSPAPRRSPEHDRSRRRRRDLRRAHEVGAVLAGALRISTAKLRIRRQWATDTGRPLGFTADVDPSDARTAVRDVAGCCSPSTTTSAAASERRTTSAIRLAHRDDPVPVPAEARPPARTGSGSAHLRPARRHDRVGARRRRPRRPRLVRGLLHCPRAHLRRRRDPHCRPAPPQPRPHQPGRHPPRPEADLHRPADRRRHHRPRDREPRGRHPAPRTLPRVRGRPH